MRFNKSIKYSLLSILLLLAVVLIADVIYYRKATYTYTKTESTNTTPKYQALPGANKSKPNQLAIPSLNILAPIIYIDKTGEAAFQEALINGVVHYPGTALPGQKGNVYIFGHSSDLPWSKGNYKTIFELLPQIKKGSVIAITDSNGTLFHYQVTNQFVVGSKDVSVLTQPKDTYMLTLQTSYPIGTALKRYIVQAELTEEEQEKRNDQ